MKVFYLFISLFWLCISYSQQPPICGSNPAMTSFCNQACIICDIDGFTGRNNSTITGQQPPGFCTSFAHHMQWIGFIAGSTNLTLEVRVSNCSRNEGLEIGLYESFDCTVFRRISECDTDIRPGEVRIFKNTVPLVIGQYYYFVMDGSDNDICDWTIKVTEGSTKVSPLDFSAEIIIPDLVCENELFEIITPGVAGATLYNWSVDGVQKKIGTSFMNSFEKPGVYKVCLDASNVCDQAPQACKNVTVLPTPKSTVSQELCYGECFTFLGQKFCEGGTYEIRLPSSNGCDSIISFNLSIKDKVKAFSDINICDGDTLSIGNGNLFSAGLHETTIKNQEGCDIHLTINLNLIICNIQSNLEIIPVKCNGENNGSIRIRIEAATPPLKYRASKVENASIEFSGIITSLSEWIVIDELDEGNYTINIEDNFGNNKVINAFVAQPPLLTAKTSVSDYNGYGISCFDAKDGYIKIIPEGGVGPYSYEHDFYSENVDSVSLLSVGFYRSEITDANGCKTISNMEIKSPEKLKVVVEYKNPDCTGPNTGEYRIAMVAGGVPAYTHMLNKEIIEADKLIKTLGEGEFTLTTTDKNGCISILKDTLIASIIPDIKVVNALINVELGDSIELVAFSNLTQQQIKWSPDINMTCSDCLTAKVLPLDNSNYTIRVISKDGCEEEATVEVRVLKKRSFIISNIFSPDGDGINDKIRYFAGKDVEKLDYIRVYDRWGSLVYLSENILSDGISDLDWDGIFHGQYLISGVFTWLANVTYIDGETLFYRGNMTLIK